MLGNNHIVFQCISEERAEIHAWCRILSYGDTKAALFFIYLNNSPQVSKLTIYEGHVTAKKHNI